MYEFISGAIAVASFVVGLFFYQFYKKVNDRFFLMFAIAFQIFALERFVLVSQRIGDELQSLVYIIRLVGYVIIITAIVDKNRKRTPRSE